MSSDLPAPRKSHTRLTKAEHLKAVKTVYEAMCKGEHRKPVLAELAGVSERGVHAIVADALKIMRDEVVTDMTDARTRADHKFSEIYRMAMEGVAACDLNIKKVVRYTDKAGNTTVEEMLDADVQRARDAYLKTAVQAAEKQAKVLGLEENTPAQGGQFVYVDARGATLLTGAALKRAQSVGSLDPQRVVDSTAIVRQEVPALTDGRAVRQDDRPGARDAGVGGEDSADPGNPSV